MTLILSTLNELTDAINQARETNIPLVDYGIYHAKVGHTPPEKHTLYSLSGDIVEHYVNDFTVTAHAGITMGQLNAQLIQANQFLPINCDDDLTLGEVINHNIYGAMRVRYGSIRDQLLGLHYLDNAANDIHVGGRTVKNVAGLDVTRLMIGSMGELGLVHQATLRTYALPQQVARVDLELTSLDNLAQQITDWMLGPAYPTSIHLRRMGDTWQLEAAYFGNEKANDVQVQALKNTLPEDESIVIADERRVNMTQHLIDGMKSRQWQRKCKTLVKIVVPPREVVTLANTLAQMGVTQISGMPAHGCLLAGGASLDSEMDQKLIKLLLTIGGIRQWITPPVYDDGKTACVTPFAPDQPDWEFLKKIKKTMDPRNLFNPGRFLENEVLA
ncbi:MAG TPA: hypothetical protein DCM28_22470 [Phycisphaerales bacterium]|nr:hypothetical protein [Phycisphaerales bacterium]